MKKHFLATVDPGITLPEDFKENLKKQGIEMVAYYKNLNIVKLASENDLQQMDLAPLKNIEPDGEVKALGDDKNADNNRSL